MNKEDIQKLLLKYPTKIPIYLDIQSNHLVKTRIKYMFEKTLTLQYVLNIITKQISVDTNDTCEIIYKISDYILERNSHMSINRLHQLYKDDHELLTITIVRNTWTNFFRTFGNIFFNM